MTRAALLSLLVACSPITRYGLKRCPALAPQAADVAATGVGLIISVDAYTNHDNLTAALSAGVAMGIAVLANVSECR